MKQIIEAFSAVILIALCAFAGIAIITVSSDILAAKEYKQMSSRKWKTVISTRKL